MDDVYGIRAYIRTTLEPEITYSMKSIEGLNVEKLGIFLDIGLIFEVNSHFRLSRGLTIHEREVAGSNPGCKIYLTHDDR